MRGHVQAGPACAVMRRLLFLPIPMLYNPFRMFCRSLRNSRRDGPRRSGPSRSSSHEEALRTETASSEEVTATVTHTRTTATTTGSDLPATTTHISRAWAQKEAGWPSPVVMPDSLRQRACLPIRQRGGYSQSTAWSFPALVRLILYTK